jgi:DNA invertase Pin-like site-specific DNA recombinase
MERPFRSAEAHAGAPARPAAPAVRSVPRSARGGPNTLPAGRPLPHRGGAPLAGVWAISCDGHWYAGHPRRAAGRRGTHGKGDQGEGARGTGGDGHRGRVYLRVSSDQQTTANQLPDCHQLAAARGWRVVEVYKDDGVQGDARTRPGLERALLDAHTGRYKVLVVWALDRLSRDGASGALRIIERLEAAGVALVSVREPCLDTAGPFRDVVVSLVGTFAKMEKARLKDRIAAAKARLGRWGRRATMTDAQAQRARQMKAEGWSTRSIAMTLRAPRTTIRRALARAQ